jgi:CheY-like chemotaxis protein
MTLSPLNLLLADDDTDDCTFFKEVLEELPHATALTTVNDGVQLMNHLKFEIKQLPDALYLDLNMPRKTGSECLAEIKQNAKLKHLPIIIFSTSFNPDVVNSLREQGANYYIRKPAEFYNLKAIISKSLDLIKTKEKPSKENFVLNSK